MRFTVLIALLTISFSCYSQKNYEDSLARRLDQIRHLKMFDNGIVVYNEPVWFNWQSDFNFYSGDIVAFNYITYEALEDNKNVIPGTAPNVWRVLSGPHPYLFLRDTAKIEDLVQLLKSDHPYIRIYAFGALAYRNADNLFEIVVDNLSDTTNIEQMTSDYGFNVFPADLMLWYTIERFSSSQKDILRKLILTQYSHLITLESILLSHKPVPEDYPYVRKIAQGKNFKKFGLVALAGYKKQEDVELIHQGLKDKDHYSDHRVIFIAIETFPHPTFKKDLIEYKKEIKMEAMPMHKYYFNSLAAYKDKECLSVLEELVDQSVDTNDRYKTNYRDRNLRIMRDALKKHHIKMFDALIRKIEKLISKTNSEEELYDVERNPWSY